MRSGWLANWFFIQNQRRESYFSQTTAGFLLRMSWRMATKYAQLANHCRTSLARKLRQRELVFPVAAISRITRHLLSCRNACGLSSSSARFPASFRARAHVH